MAFVVEDETGLETATSYVEVADADSYFADRGISAWTNYTNTEKEDALVNAADYADIRWGESLRGLPLTATQALRFPRINIYTKQGTAIEGVPTQWKYAVYEYALRYLQGTLYPEESTTQKEIKREKKTVGPITKEVEYMGTAKASAFVTIKKADSWAKSFTYSQVSGRVVR